jgi:tellurite methyltransferase
MEKTGQTPSAAQVWDQRWQDGKHRNKWQKPSGEVLEIAWLWREQGLTRALDLGCGLGRHTVALARMGYTVTGTDPSPLALVSTRAALNEAGQQARLVSGGMHHLPFAPESFDYALAVGVIMHGDGPALGRALSELRRVLRPGGVLQATLLSKRNLKFGMGRKVAPDTWVREGRGEGGDPHYFCMAKELMP